MSNSIKQDWTCPQAWQNFYINQHGELYVCCLNNTLIGNLKETDFMTAWQGHTVRHLRSLHLAGDYINSSCQATCHELVKRFPNNVAKIGTGFPGYNENAKTGNAALDSLPESTLPIPADQIQNEKYIAQEIRDRCCGTHTFPSRGLIIPIAKCNLRCPMCDTGVLGEKIPDVLIPDQALNKLIVVYPYLSYLEIVGAGEIFYYPPEKSPMKKILLDLQKYASPKLHLLLQTNGIALKKSWVDFLVQTDVCSTLSVSIDTVDPSAYRVVRKGGEIDNLKKNLDYLEEQKAKHGRIKPSYRFSVVLSDYTFTGLPKLVEFVNAYDTSYLYLQLLQKGGHEWFVNEHNVFKRERETELLRYREILNEIGIPSNKEDIMEIIDRILSAEPVVES